MANSSQNSASGVDKAMDSAQQVSEGEATIESLEKSVFTIPEPVREDQVQNAVNFLSHPKVRGSPVLYRRAFLEKKGLRKEEIDEAFRRVPDPSLNAEAVEAPIADQANKTITQPTSVTLQPQVPYQISKQSPSIPSPTTSFHQLKFHWSQAIFVLGLLAASGAGMAVLFKKMFVPKLKAWVRKVVAEKNDFKLINRSKANVAEEAAEAAKAAASAAAVVAVASQEFVNAKHEERKYFETFTRLLDVQLEEMKSIGNVIRKIEVSRKELTDDNDLHTNRQSDISKGIINNPWGTDQVDHSSSSTLGAQHQKVNGSLNMKFGTVRPLSNPPSTIPTPPPSHPKSYMEIIEMIQRGERPPNIKDIDDSPPNPNQPIAKPCLPPRPKPWEVSQQGSTFGLQSKANGLRLNSEVYNSQLNESHSTGVEPWRSKQSIQISEIESDPEEQFYDAVRSIGSPMKRGWVPTEPPAFLMPEAADAIRQPKSSTQRQQSGDDSLMISSSNIHADKPQNSGSTLTDLNLATDQERGAGVEIK
ncbi:peroxisomal membrane protein PEX14-like isoform X1 [Zingiber officinale]|uniref:peroxisomal membrane protein PEX14-like isoform X1 n=1 Tax=Zingiber officinale TaxID=94328 RepID=UPI001C4D4A33|nr:peroxisomal membrane protein PEX14-like isoform X1 [Zingiber officinale]